MVGGLPRLCGGAILVQMKLRILTVSAALCMTASPAWARSVLEGLEIIESDKGGVEVLSVAPGSPAAQSGLQPGDRITSIGKTKVKGLDDYVALSKGLKQSGAGVSIGYLREGAAGNADLSLHSNSLREKWGIPVAPWRESKGGGEAQGSEYWLDRAQRELRDIGKRAEAARPEDHGRAILSLFTALDANPDLLATAVLIARQYVKLAELYFGRGENTKAAWCLRRALQIYGNAVQKAGGIQELVLVKNGLGEMQKSLEGVRRGDAGTRMDAFGGG